MPFSYVLEISACDNAELTPYQIEKAQKIMKSALSRKYGESAPSYEKREFSVDAREGERFARFTIDHKDPQQSGFVIAVALFKELAECKSIDTQMSNVRLDVYTFLTTSDSYHQSDRQTGAPC